MKILKSVLIALVITISYSSSVLAMTDDEVICGNKSEKCQSACKLLQEGKLKDFERDTNGNIIASPKAAAKVNCL